MLNRKDRQERGQAILLMALALIGMLGFAAVALDGGNIYSEQRRAQSAADNAVLAAAYQYMRGITVSSTISNAAIDNALANDYDNNSTSNWVKFYRPPIVGVYAGNSSYMQVVITERVPTALAHLVYQGPFQLTVYATGYAKKGGPPVDGNAVVSLAPHGCQTFFDNGNATISVTGGGGLFANSDGKDADGNDVCTGSTRVMDAGGGGHINSDAPISVVADASDAYGGDISPAPQSGAEPIPSDPLSDLNKPKCNTAPGESTDLTSGSPASPGTYRKIDIGNNNVTLSPGLYCIMYDGNNAVNLGSSGVLSGTGVTIYVDRGEVSLQGGTVKLKAPSAIYNPECATLMQWDAPDDSVCHYVGIVFFMGRDNTRGLTLSGNANYEVIGTVYGPSSRVTLAGNGDWTLTGQILANSFKTTGNGEVKVHYDPSVIHQPAPTISLMQ